MTAAAACVYVFFHIKVRVKSNVFFLDALQPR
jgi:hypothetical protein